MKIFKSMAGVLLLAFLSSGVANADDSELGLGVKAGTLGLGLEGRWSGLPYMDLRLGANAYDLGYDGREAGIRYDGNVDLETYYLTANFHFPLSPFRITIGAFANSNQINLVGAETGNYDFAGAPRDWTQSEVGVLTSTTSFDSTAPYVGLGFDFELFGKAGLNFDVGVLLQGDPEVTLVSTGTAYNDPDPLIQVPYRASLEAERLELEDDMSDFKAYPVVSLSFVYNF